MEKNRYLTAQEAANELGISLDTLYAYVSRGMLKSYRQGIKRQRLYRRSEIESLLRLAPSSTDETPAGGRAAAAEVPLAESWIRE
jgi:citrate synthase